MNFVQQHRCVDAQFQEILNVISYYKPSRRTLKELHGKRVLCSPEPTEAELLSVLQDHPDGMILKVTRAAAATINRIAVNNLFPDVDPCGYVKYDGTDKFQPIYKGMKVIITQNRDKELHIVNGQTDSDCTHYAKCNSFSKTSKRPHSSRLSSYSYSR